MASNLSLSICLTDLPKSKMVRSDKNGKVYINLDAYVKDEKDTYGKDVAVSIPFTKEEREMNPKPARVYVGNGNSYVYESTNKPVSDSDVAGLGFTPGDVAPPVQAPNSDGDDLPF